MQAFSVLIKPASSLCNLRCKYCFYADVSESRAVRSYGIMSRETSHTLIDRCLAQLEGDGVLRFAFQGGEPTLAGLDFFRDFAAYAEQALPFGVTAEYAMQTNGVLLTDEWCEFLREKAFLVGLSLDGPAEIHDAQRIDAAGNGSFKTVRHAARLLKKHCVDFNILTVVTKAAARHPKQLYDFYRRQNYNFLQFILCLPALEETGASLSAHIPLPRQYSAFLKELFRLWYEGIRQGSYISIRLFDNLVRMLRGEKPELCGMLGKCSPQFVIEADGGVYPCDFYVLDKYRAGSFQETPFSDLKNSPAMLEFLSPLAVTEEICVSCKVRTLCGGGCKRYRSYYHFEKGYCPYQDFLYTVFDGLQDIAMHAG